MSVACGVSFYHLPSGHSAYPFDMDLAAATGPRTPPNPTDPTDPKRLCRNKGRPRRVQCGWSGPYRHSPPVESLHRGQLVIDWICFRNANHLMVVHSLKLTACSPLKIGLNAPKGNEKVFQRSISRCELLVSGRVNIYTHISYLPYSYQSGLVGTLVHKEYESCKKRSAVLLNKNVFSSPPSLKTRIPPLPSR